MRIINEIKSKWSVAVCAMLCAASMCACGGDDETLPSGGEGVSPDATVPDPEGTIHLSMRDYNNGKTYLGDRIYIKDENFTEAMFSSLGTVKGLGNVAHIPTSGWADKVAVVPGNGYVAYHWPEKWYRIYVTDYIVSTTGGIIGAEVKYQAPFKGKDEAIQLDTQTLTFPAEGGTQTLTFKNTGIVLFDVDTTDLPDWCTVEKASTYDQWFLANGIAITVEGSTSSAAEEGAVTLTTPYGKKTVVKVTRAGAEPFLSLSETEKELSAAAQTETVGLAGNVPFANLVSSSSAAWCQAELVDDSQKLRAASRTVKFVGDKPVSATRADEGLLDAAMSYSLKLTLGENTSTSPRTATVTVKSKDGRASATLKVVQKGITFEVKSDRVGFDKNASYRTLTINTTVSDWEAQSSASWCTFSKNGNQLTIRATASTTDRTATVSFKGFDTKITVHQSKYTVGDEFSENGVEGTVGYIGDTVRYVYKELESSQWSTENVATGATSETDGLYNVSVIKKIPFWEDSYPAFLLCDRLNTDGVTGWYLPASEELKLLPGVTYSRWSSTEYNTNYAKRINWGNDYNDNKSYSCNVVAVHKF